MDTVHVARELLIALRGRRTQTAWSEALGYQSNVVWTWETGRHWPTGAQTLRAAGIAGVDLPAALTLFYGAPPPWLDELDPASPEGVAQLLNDLRGTASVTDVARRAGLSRTAVSRWLSATTQPRLPDFLTMIQATSLRLVDWVAAFVEPDAVPAILPQWDKLEARRKGAFSHPWTQAVLRALELTAYRELPRHRKGWIADHLGIDVALERTCLDVLRAGGHIGWDGSHYQLEPLIVDTRRHPEIGRRLKQHWTEVAGERVRSEAPGHYINEVVSVSREDFERIRELHLTTFHALRAIVAESEPAECVAIVNMQLFALRP